MKKPNTKLLIIFLLALSITVLVAGLISCDKTKVVYFSEPTYYVFLDQGTTITPDIVSRPKDKAYSIKSANTTIVKVQEDGKTLQALKEGAVTLTVESGGITANAKVMVFSSINSAAIPSKQDNKVALYFVSEAGSFPSQRLNLGDLGVDPSALYQRDGYRLFGWYEDNEYTRLFDFENTPITKTTVLFALWGVDTPEYKFISIENNIYVDGLKYGYIPYETITLPVTDNAERPVYGVNEYAFSENLSAKSIIIPAGYKEIKKYAFAGSQKIESVEIDGEIEYIREYAFSENEKLKTFSVAGTSLLEIGKSAFESCYLLETVSLPNSLLQIGESAFKSCLKLTNFETPESLLKIYNSAFMSSGLTSINLKVTEEIGTQAFWGCFNLESVTGGTSLKSLGSYAFGSYVGKYQSYATKWLREAVIYDNPTKETKLLYIGNALIYAYPGMIKPEYSIKETVSVIAGECFADIEGAIITFRGTTPPSSIGAYAFGGTLSDPVCKSDIIIPAGKMDNYVNAFLQVVEVSGAGWHPTAYSFSTVNHFYEKWLCADAALQIYKRRVIKWIDSITKEWGYSTSDVIHILVGGYDKKINPILPPAINVKEVTDDAASFGEYVVDKVKAYAFNNDNVIETIYMPIYILEIESNAFAGLTKCSSIHFNGDIAWTPSRTKIYQHSFNFSQMPAGCKIYVPSDKVATYISLWNYSTLESRIYGE